MSHCHCCVPAIFLHQLLGQNRESKRRGGNQRQSVTFWHLASISTSVCASTSSTSWLTKWSPSTNPTASGVLLLDTCPSTCVITDPAISPLSLEQASSSLPAVINLPFSQLLAEVFGFDQICQHGWYAPSQLQSRHVWQFGNFHHYLHNHHHNTIIANTR